MDGQVSRVWMRVDMLQAKVMLGILDQLEAKNTDCLLGCRVRGRGHHPQGSW